MEPTPPASNRRRRSKHRSLSDSVSLVGSYTVGWAAPIEQVRFLVSNGDAHRWVGFRDGFMSKWTNLNIVCGLIMGAMSTVMFADVELDRVSFGFGVVSLLSSLISIGFGTGLMYVLGDVEGRTLHKIGVRYPILFVFALSIPQVWAGICIATFFLCVSVFAWNASDKGWTPKAGIIFAAVLTIFHLLAFARLFHKQHTVESLIDEETDGGIEHNIHLPYYSRKAQLSDTVPDRGGRPEPIPFDTQYGGSGLGHLRPSPPVSQNLTMERQLELQPLVDSPDPTSSPDFASRQSQRGGSNGGSGRARYVDLSSSRAGRSGEREGGAATESVSLFAPFEGQEPK